MDEELCYELVEYSVDELQSYFNDDIVPNFPIVIRGHVEGISDCRHNVRLIFNNFKENEVPTVVKLFAVDKTVFEDVEIGDYLVAPCIYMGWEWLVDNELRLAHFKIIP